MKKKNQNREFNPFSLEILQNQVFILSYAERFCQSVNDQILNKKVLRILQKTKVQCNEGEDEVWSPNRIPRKLYRESQKVLGKN